MQNISSLQKPTSEQERACPECRTLLPVYQDFVTWCHNCNWNIKPHEAEKPRNIFESFYNNIGQRLSSSMYNELASVEASRRRPTKGNALAYGVAAMVHAFTLGLFLLGVFIIVRSWPAFLIVLLGVFIIVLAWYVRPKLPKKVQPGAITRQTNPALYEMTDKVCDALNTSRVEAIFVNEDFNASVTVAGWRRQKVLVIGMPLFSILSDEERLALLGHEIGHFANGDPTRTIFISTAIHTLVEWYPLLLPAPSYSARPGLLVLVIRPISNLFMRGLAGMVKVVVSALSHLSWHNSQRAEYLADSMAAQIGGSAAMISMLEKLHYHEFFELVVQRVSLSRKSPDLFAEYHQYIKEVPERELERIRRVELLDNSRLDCSHPPTGYRVALLRSKPVIHPKVSWTTFQSQQLEAELAKFYRPVQTKLIEKMHEKLY